MYSNGPTHLDIPSHTQAAPICICYYVFVLPLSVSEFSELLLIDVFLELGFYSGVWGVLIIPLLPGIECFSSPREHGVNDKGGLTAFAMDNIDFDMDFKLKILYVVFSPMNEFLHKETTPVSGTVSKAKEVVSSVISVINKVFIGNTSFFLCSQVSILYKPTKFLWIYNGMLYVLIANFMPVSSIFKYVALKISV